jgi:hypothetical protein
MIFHESINFGGIEKISIAKVKNVSIRRRQAQTFSSADMAEENRLALRAGKTIRARRSAGELRMVFNREAIAFFSSAGHGAKNP